MRKLTILSLVLSFISLFALSASAASFPFQNISLPPGGTLQASYSFTDSNGTHPIIFCYQSINNTNVKLTWPYKGKSQTAVMPIQLKTNAIYQGSFADTNGTLVVTNNSGSKQLVSCQYAF